MSQLITIHRPFLSIFTKIIHGRNYLIFKILLIAIDWNF